MKRRICHNPIAVSPRSSRVAAQPAQDGQTPIDECFDTLISGMPSLASLFEKLGSDEHPDFMTVWLTISEMVAFYTEPRPESQFEFGSAEKTSEKKCRFCD